MKQGFGCFLTGEGKLRLGWRLAAGVLGYVLAFYGVLWAEGAVFGALFAAWGLTNDNLVYAPLWAQQIVLWHTDFSYALAYLAALLPAFILNRKKPAPDFRQKKTGFGLLLGAGIGAALTAAALAMDSMRLERALYEPAFSAHHVSALIVLLLGSFSGEVLSKRLVFRPVSERYGRGMAYAAAALLSVLLSGMWTEPVGLLNAALLAIVGCAVYERGDIYASTALAAGWSAWTTWLFAWPNGGAVSIYRLYSVSENWLTGGNAGANAGFGATIGWITIAAVLLRGTVRLKKERITNGKDSHCNRRSGLSR